MIRAPSQAALLRAAKVAAAEGVCIVIEADGVTYRFEPVAKPQNSAQLDADRIDLMDLKRRG